MSGDRLNKRKNPSFRFFYNKIVGDVLGIQEGGCIKLNLYP